MDDLLFRGEVSPIVIVGLLLATTVSAGAIWETRGLAAMDAPRPPCGVGVERPTGKA